MSTNINNQLPDIDLLTQLANQFFKGGNSVVNKSEQADPSKVTQAYSPLQYQGYLTDSQSLQTGPPDPAIANLTGIPSLSGIGRSSELSSSAFTQIDQVNGIDLRPNASLSNSKDSNSNSGGLGKFKDSHLPLFEEKNKTNSVILNDNRIGASNIPQSVAGSGISPSATGRQNDFDIKDPQTSLPDPHFTDGKIPASVAGSGKSPSIKNEQTKSDTQSLPYSSDSSFENGLLEALASINTFINTPQLPIKSDQPTFYFLPSVNYFSETGGQGSTFTDELVSAKAQHAIAPPFDVNLVRKDFPILREKVNGKPLIWLDNAATTQKPQQVIDRISYFYEHENSNIHRAAHELAARATDAYEAAREKVRQFINAASPNEIVFVRGTTEAINLVAKSWGEQYLLPGDEIILSHLEHHANIVPWQQLAGKKGLKLKIIPVDDSGQILLDEYAKLLGPKVKLVSFTHVSNALGTITPAKQMIEMAHGAGAKVLLDGAQSISHMRVDMQQLNPDWFVFSGHKVFGPTGIGALYGKEELLNATIPWQGGGNMIKDVTFEHTVFHNAPGRFEAGTGNIADAVGLGAALDYVSKVGIDLISQYEHYLLIYATKLLKQVPGLTLIGTASEKASVLSFVLNGYKTEEVGAILNQQGIAVRSGHHCAQPILRRFGQEATVRPSLAFYNTCSEVDTLYNTLINLNRK